MNIPALNTARHNYLIGLARKCEEGAWRHNWRTHEKLLKLAAVYREMAVHCIDQALLDPSIANASASERSELAEKLRRMTVENGCTPAEAQTAMEMLWRLEAKQ